MMKREASQVNCPRCGALGGIDPCRGDNNGPQLGEPHAERRQAAKLIEVATTIQEALGALGMNTSWSGSTIDIWDEADERRVGVVIVRLGQDAAR